ncbi:SENP1 [Mytilus edulis]|nr:SENP1 [Mytilus edulis]
MIERSQRISTDHKDYRSSEYLSDSWVSGIMSKYSSSARDRTRKIAEAELKAKLYEERRKGKDDDLEKRLRIQMRLYEKVPAVTEDLPVELSEEEEEKEEVLPEITPEMDDVINKALRGQPAHEVLVEGYRLQITRGDIATLAGLNWLNDEVINFYMNMLMERGEKDNYPKCYAFNTFFYPKIMSGGHSTVRRWTKKVDIFSYDYLIVPVHLGMHWCLCIVDFKKKCIKYYDSMGGQNVKCLNAVKQYLCDECKDKKNQQFDQSGWSTEIAEDIPQQMNGSDCGMFACKFADYITRGANITFEQKHMSYFRRRMVYEIVKKNLLQ